MKPYWYGGSVMRNGKRVPVVLPESIVDELIDNIIRTPDAEILEEAKEDYGDSAYEANRVRDLLDKSRKKLDMGAKQSMPHRAKKPCNHPGCGTAIPAKDKHCIAHLPLHKDDYKRKIPQTGIYASPRWRKYRQWYLNRNPACVHKTNQIECGELATVIDHIIPVNQGGSFWHSENHQAMCKRHHDKKTATEDGGFGNKPI